MGVQELDLFKELDPRELQKKFLNSLLQIQNVRRGSIWVKKKDSYVCVEAAGDESENILGVHLDSDHPSIVGWVIKNKKMAIAETKSDQRHFREVEEDFAVKSSMILCFPLIFREDQVFGAVQIIDTTPAKSQLNLDKDYLSTLQNLVDICSIALSNALLFSEEKNRTRHLTSALSRIEKNNAIVGQSSGFQASMDLVKSYAGTDFHVLITGESGTGKELAAEQIHRLSSRRDKPFLVQNCSAIPETLLESELFGYRKGAFTGAAKDKAGLFEAADGGTVFLDEIGDMPMSTQASLLRVLQKNEVKPLGDTRVRYVDIRIVAATNKDIKKMISENNFRQDLFYRLSVLPVHLPSLRERREDIPLLAKYFLEKESAKAGIPEKKILSGAMQHLVAYDWPGNIRELENLIRYLMVITPSDAIETMTIPPNIRGENPDTDEANPGEGLSEDQNEFTRDLSTLTWPGLERAYVDALLKKHNWNVTWAARASGVNRSTFASRMRKLGVRRDDLTG
ncbi:sigma-54 interaction domain-containing protein [Desulfospira joergensenii]|uniref:sigma-54 interaction domain-containing protein n=1 Tax=Desulfospira joergensenii TaxID=53329 RepID=UPI0003B65F8A|nr:sigma-54-dependent Fis family transcriptional regulator [Desulfospira joergensenii]